MPGLRGFFVPETATVGCGDIVEPVCRSRCAEQDVRAALSGSLARPGVAGGVRDNRCRAAVQSGDSYEYFLG